MFFINFKKENFIMEPEFNLMNINAFKDTFTGVAAFVNPQMHCRLARVCKPLNQLIISLWQQKKHNTEENRTWLTKLYLARTFNPNIVLELTKANLTQTLVLSFFQGLSSGQNNAGNQLIVELGKEGLMKQLESEFRPLVEQVVDKHQEEIFKKTTKANLESLVKNYSLAQIKRHIDWQDNPSTFSLFQKLQTQVSLSFDMTEKLSQLVNEVIVPEFEKLDKSQTEDKLELPISKSDKKNFSINIQDLQEDTLENRILCMKLLCEETEFLFSSIDIFKKGMINGCLQGLALKEKINIDAITDEQVKKANQSVDRVFIRQFEAIRSTWKEIVIEQYSQSFSITEIKELCFLCIDDFQMTIFNSQPQIVHHTMQAMDSYMKELMKEILTIMGIPEENINKIIGKVD